MIVFASNFMNHHQLPLCNELWKICPGDFYFIATESISNERLRLGYEDLNSCYEFIVPAYHGENEREYAEQLCREADVLILGSAPERYIRLCHKNAIILRYSERPYKNYIKIKAIISEIIHHYSFLMYKNIYMLCASAYTAQDHAQFGMYRSKCFKWGYFPAVLNYEEAELFSRKNSFNEDHVSILWVGRLISWKHPEAALQIAKKLCDNGYTFQMDIVGTGECEAAMRHQISECGLQNCVSMRGPVPQEAVRGWMLKSDIFLFTSDFNEGWGAVLNESMNSGCAVVASHAIGAVPYLIKHRENGLIYHSGNMDELYENVKYLLDHPMERERLGKAAYETIVGEWNAETAAERLVDLAKHLLSGEKYPDLYPTGPCSRAEILSDTWF